MKLSEYELKSIEKLEKSIMNGNFSNNGLVQLIELIGTYLNIDTIPNYCKKNNISYNGAKKNRNTRIIFGVKFVIDNK